MGVKLCINYVHSYNPGATPKDKPLVVGRWSNKISDTQDIKCATAEGTPVLYATLSDSWNTWYTAFIQDRKAKLLQRLSSTWLTSINGLKPIDSRFFILGGNCINIKNSTSTVALYDNSTDTTKYIVDETDYQNAIDKLMRCQMCIYHFLNQTLHKLLNTESPHGIFYRYLGLQARWNAYVYGAKCRVEAISTDNGVCIDVGYVNVECEPIQVEITIDVTVTNDPVLDPIVFVLDGGKTIMMVDPISLHSLYLDEFGGVAGEHEFTRGSEDVTDPNTSKWGLYKWKTGKFHTKVPIIQYGEYTRFVYSIRKNSNAIGYYRNSDQIFEFDLDITIKAGPTSMDSSNLPIVYKSTKEAYCSILEQSTNQYVGDI